MTDHPPIVRCPACGGRGQLDLDQLSRTAWKTLQVLRKFGPLTAGELRTCMPDCYSDTAANNRLETLRKLGCAARRKHVPGCLNRSRWEYFAIEMEAPEPK